MPSMIEAWLSSSEIDGVLVPSSASNSPPLASKHELNRIVSSVPRNSDRRSSSSLVQRLRAADEAHRRHPVAPALERLVRCLDRRPGGRRARGSCWRTGSAAARPSTSTCARCGDVDHELALVEPRLASSPSSSRDELLLQRSVHGSASLRVDIGPVEYHLARLTRGGDGERLREVAVARTGA